MDKDNEFNVVEKINGNGGTANNMEGGEHVGNIRGKGYDKADADAANAYDAKDKYGSKGKDMAAAATTHNKEEKFRGCQ